MCEKCGCKDRDAVHGHEHEHDHEHHHDHEPRQRLITLERKILSRNDRLAAENRAWLSERGVTALNLISAPGSGKTMLLERTLERLCDRISCAVIAGDQQTDRDARRLQGKGAPVYQIETVSACHLEAERVGRAMREIVTRQTRLLLIENVGNLVCPTGFDLGETCKVALMAVTEGEDKPLKYPALFALAPVAVITKTDLLPHLDFSMAQCLRYLRRVQPGVRVLELSARTGDGMEAWLGYLEERLRASPAAQC